MKKNYFFQSQRLGFRNWIESDSPKMIAISLDPEVMEFFPATSTPEQSEEFIERMKEMYAQKGYCYFAVDLIASQEFIGFIGLCDQTYESDFTPCVDIGWRLDKAYWNKGLATEGARRCLDYAFKNLGLINIKAIAPKINLKSIKVMQKIGMNKQLEFKHPLLTNFKKLEKCVCYEIEQ